MKNQLIGSLLAVLSLLSVSAHAQTDQLVITGDTNLCEFCGNWQVQPIIGEEGLYVWSFALLGQTPFITIETTEPSLNYCDGFPQTGDYTLQVIFILRMEVPFWKEYPSPLL
ncbi:MAG: hypothetical protein R2795_20585 [Saprospiraceae bacterium]